MPLSSLKRTERFELVSSSDVVLFVSSLCVKQEIKVDCRINVFGCYLGWISLSQLSTFQNSRYGLSSSVNIKFRNNCCIQVIFHILNRLWARVYAASFWQGWWLQCHRLRRLWWRLIRVGIFNCLDNFNRLSHCYSFDNIRSLIFRIHIFLIFRVLFLRYTRLQMKARHQITFTDSETTHKYNKQISGNTRHIWKCQERSTRTINFVDKGRRKKLIIVQGLCYR